MSATKTEKNRDFLACNICMYTSYKKSDFNKHINTKKHKYNSLHCNKTTEITEKTEDLSFLFKYNCFICHFNTSDKKDYVRHKTTRKHCLNEEKQKSIINNSEETNYKELLLISLKQNKEMQDFIIKQSEQYQQTIENQQNTINEIIPKINNTNNTHNIINSNINNNFNLNFFLNEKCKDAITMDEFLNKIKVSLSNLLYTKEKGIAEGLSNIFIENMNKIPLTQRPIHCTDIKRETIYIKNEQWEKDENKSQTKDVIKKLSNIQIKNICKFKEAYPELMKNEKQKDDYMEIIKTTTDDIQNKEEKVIKSICKNTYIKDKSIE